MRAQFRETILGTAGRAREPWRRCGETEGASVAVLKQNIRFLAASLKKMVRMIEFLQKIRGFVRPYRGRFFMGLLCGVFYGLANGLLPGAVKVVIDLIFTKATNFHEQLEKAPHWIQPAPHWLGTQLAEFSAPTLTWGWVLVAEAAAA